MSIYFVFVTPILNKCEIYRRIHEKKKKIAVVNITDKIKVEV
jgi:hypothetical protein